MTPDTTKTPNEMPLLTRRTSRRARRIARQKRQRKITAAIISGALLLTGGGAFAWNQLKPISALEVSELFPAKTDDLRVFSPQSLMGGSSEKILTNLQAYSASLEEKADNEANDEGQTNYLTQFVSEIKDFTEFHRSHDWLGTAFADGKWDEESLTAYSIKSSGKAKEFMLSPECKDSFFEDYCGEGNFAIAGSWLLTGTPSALALHATENKDERIRKETSLAVNATFAQQTEALASGDNAILLWTNSENVTPFMPLGLNDSFPQDARLALTLAPTSTGVSMTGAVYKGETDHPIFDKEPISDSILKLPANTVTAISVSNAYDDVKNMLDSPEAFINTQTEWVSLRNAIEGYGATLPDDLPKIFGTTTTFSLNRGSVGNEVAGTLRMTGSESEVPMGILNNAAKEAAGITEMYTVREGSDDFLIESHSPITDGSLSENLMFAKVIGPMDKSIAVAYIDLDNTWALIDSNYSKTKNEEYDAGILGINLSRGSSERVDISMNWEIVKE